ncbi:hypothetical protein PIB30_030563 [Stylosanthes scabra]|uniref:Uncharacterized protein n=1 Tax=Stylosanthes scabra TaxID=79078 RepID=A0ABU6SB80_9FABA|nr:hypothetical protein [Stylosanthes scabra]
MESGCFYRKHIKFHDIDLLSLSSALLANLFVICSGAEVGRVWPSEDFADELFQDQCARTKDEHFSFHKNLQCSSNLQGTAGGGPARPLRYSSQIGRTLSD